MDRKGLERLASADQVRRRVEAGANINNYAAKRAIRDSRIRAGFARIFIATGTEVGNPHFMSTPRFVVVGRTLLHRNLTACVSGNLTPNSTGDIRTEFFEQEVLIGDERYSVNAAVRAYRRGDNFADWAEQEHALNSDYKGALHDLLQLDDAMNQAEDTLELLWQSLGDPKLNPGFAANVQAIKEAES